MVPSPQRAAPPPQQQQRGQQRGAHALSHPRALPTASSPAGGGPRLPREPGSASGKRPGRAGSGRRASAPIDLAATAPADSSAGSGYAAARGPARSPPYGAARRATVPYVDTEPHSRTLPALPAPPPLPVLRPDPHVVETAPPVPIVSWAARLGSEPSPSPRPRSEGGSSPRSRQQHEHPAGPAPPSRLQPVCAGGRLPTPGESPPPGARRSGESPRISEPSPAPTIPNSSLRGGSQSPSPGSRLAGSLLGAPPPPPTLPGSPRSMAQASGLLAAATPHTPRGRQAAGSPTTPPSGGSPLAPPGAPPPRERFALLQQVVLAGAPRRVQQGNSYAEVLAPGLSFQLRLVKDRATERTGMRVLVSAPAAEYSVEFSYFAERLRAMQLAHARWLTSGSPERPPPVAPGSPFWEPSALLIGSADVWVQGLGNMIEHQCTTHVLSPFGEPQGRVEVELNPLDAEGQEGPWEGERESLDPFVEEAAELLGRQIAFRVRIGETQLDRSGQWARCCFRYKVNAQDPAEPWTETEEVAVEPDGSVHFSFNHVHRVTVGDQFVAHLKHGRALFQLFGFLADPSCGLS
eukprot:TRINITY_DN2737_c2_g1_i2.p1 TRINITY_DN2737_c2_g1~~TRINITY_DN2737_c2_g1_i2.p1  ORF type:complete len:577 (+),score=120.91 TRINITY_DN2737_c2_g1_i2:73-1803(+)